MESAVTEKSLFEGYNADLTDEAAVQQLIARILADHRGLDAVVNAVGAYAGGVPLWELESKVFDRMMALNLRAGFILAHAVVPWWLKQRSAEILYIASKAPCAHAAG